MATWKAEKKVSCFNDCRQAGCPSHTLRVELQTTADVLIVYKDDHQLAAFEPPEWNALKEILHDWNYNQFNLTRP